MKKLLFGLAAFAFCACSHQKEAAPTTNCIDDKIAAFKNDPSAEQIIEIDAPSGKMIWFVDIYGDGVEEILRADDCSLVCIADCECPPAPILDCSEAQGPQTVIWKK